ncbi:MAG: hypothetical protein JO222_10315 [Frankiales bacterium]|nr:hypothetical protein [Frankiales bacterium]
MLVPSFLAATSSRYAAGLGLGACLVEKPRSREVGTIAVVEVPEEHHRHFKAVEVADDSLGSRVDVTCNNCQAMSGVQFVGRVPTEGVSPGFFERHARLVYVEQIQHLVVTKALHPGAVIECLSDYLAWSLVALELQNVQRAFVVNREQINEFAVVSRDLPTDE